MTDRAATSEQREPRAKSARAASRIRSTRRARSGWFLALGLASIVAVTEAAADPIAAAEDLVRATYFEGLPYDEAAGLTTAQVRRLAELLADPSEAAYHGNIVLALGMSGRAAAFAPLAAFASAPQDGEVDRSAYRARTVLPLAMGHLARKNPAALRWLLTEASRTAANPRWSFRHQQGEALARVLDEQVLTGLALSGAPAAVAVLDEVVRVGDDRATRHAVHLREFHEQIATRGARAVFGGRSE